MLTIKKYSNRRLYDTKRSVYINLEDLAQLIRSGESVEVVDAKSGEDLTRGVLVQVMLERPGMLEAVPPALLHRMIRYGGAEGLHPMVAQQLAVGFDLLEAQLQAFEAQFGWGAPPRPPDVAPQKSPETPPEPEPGEEAEPEVDKELEALRDRLAALEARLSKS